MGDIPLPVLVAPVALAFVFWGLRMILRVLTVVLNKWADRLEGLEK